jgi:hypothetical protein
MSQRGMVQEKCYKLGGMHSCAALHQEAIDHFSHVATCRAL